MGRRTEQTVGRVAKRFGLSRATLLYYEREGLLPPAKRGINGYRYYGDAELRRLRRILGYRACGVPIREIRGLLEREGRRTIERTLRAQFDRIEEEIAELRDRQRALVAMLEHGDFAPPREMSKERWTGIMRAAGLDDRDMVEWHRQFEAREPDAHRDFLASLNLDPEEIERIRAGSRTGAPGDA